MVDSSVHSVSFLGRDESVDTLQFGGSCLMSAWSIFSAANENATCTVNIQEGMLCQNIFLNAHGQPRPRERLDQIS